MSTDDAAQPGKGLLNSALTWAGLGWHVFPCVPGGKRPALRGSWQELATTNPVLIGRWWNARPYNVGIACGPSGLVVLDLDVPRHGQVALTKVCGQATGADALDSLCARCGEPAPVTFTVRTPSDGGYHLYFTDPGAGTRNSASRLGPLIDVRGAGGYVIAAGSRIDGTPYVVTNPVSPVPLPSWIAALLREPGPAVAHREHGRGAQVRDGDAYAMAALRAETQRVATASEGCRNDTLNRAAFSLGQLVAASLLPAGEVSAALTEAAARAGLPTGEASRTIRSGMTAGARLPRQVPPRGQPPKIPVPEQNTRGPVPRR